MNKAWKVIRPITALILAGVLIFVLVKLFNSVTYPGPYPYPTIAGQVNNWTDRFIVEVFIYTPFAALPLLADIILFIVSCVMIGKAKKQNEQIVST